jgi:hypothetical protein
MSLIRVTISWPVSEDEAFRAAYLAGTGETLQADPMLSDNTLRYSVTSHRITEAQIAALAAQFPNMGVS